jgi:hypothetical protein
MIESREFKITGTGSLVTEKYINGTEHNAVFTGINAAELGMKYYKLLSILHDQEIKRD